MQLLVDKRLQHRFPLRFLFIVLLDGTMNHPIELLHSSLWFQRELHTTIQIDRSPFLIHLETSGRRRRHTNALRRRRYRRWKLRLQVKGKKRHVRPTERMTKKESTRSTTRLTFELVASFWFSFDSCCATRRLRRVIRLRAFMCKRLIKRLRSFFPVGHGCTLSNSGFTKPSSSGDTSSPARYLAYTAWICLSVSFNTRACSGVMFRSKYSVCFALRRGDFMRKPFGNLLPRTDPLFGPFSTRFGDVSQRTPGVTNVYTLSLHDALPIFLERDRKSVV